MPRYFVKCLIFQAFCKKPRHFTKWLTLQSFCKMPRHFTKYLAILQNDWAACCRYEYLIIYVLVACRWTEESSIMTSGVQQWKVHTYLYFEKCRPATFPTPTSATLLDLKWSIWSVNKRLALCRPVSAKLLEPRSRGFDPTRLGVSVFWNQRSRPTPSDLMILPMWSLIFLTGTMQVGTQSCQTKTQSNKDYTHSFTCNCTSTGPAYWLGPVSGWFC